MNRPLLMVFSAMAMSIGIAAPAAAQQPAADAGAVVKRFIACPAYRDTINARKSGCWLATENESGQRFDLQQALTKPQLGHEVLVEGALPPPSQRERDACGAPVLKPVRVSVLPTTCTAATLPAEGHAGKAFQLPATVMTPNFLPQPQPAPPYATREFTVQFDLNDDYLLYQHAEVVLQEATRLAQVGAARAVLVTGYAATKPAVVSGRVVQESIATAQARAEMVAEALRRLGLPAEKIKTAWSGYPAALPGAHAALLEASKRRVSIEVQIGAVPAFPAPPPPAYVSPDTPQGSGPYRAVMEVDPGLPTHTVYRPHDMSALGNSQLPIVAFANGACLNIGNRFRYFLSEIASHGFLAIAIGPIGEPDAESSASGGRAGTKPAANSPAAQLAAAGISSEAAQRQGLPRASTMPSQLIDAIDWAVAENNRPGSRYVGRIATTQVAVMGQSCGGLQAVHAARDPRVKTLGVWNSGTWPDANVALQIAAADATKAGIAALRLPTLLVTGEPSDVAFDNSEDDYLRMNAAPFVFRAWREQTPHGGTYREPSGGAFGRVAVAWLRWQLKGDRDAGRLFTGAECGLCEMPEWHVKKKGLE